MPNKKYVFDDFYIIDPISGCWNWIGGLDGHGYAHYNSGIGTKIGHKHSYQIKFGLVPKGLDLDHTCRNIKCVNPNHLEPVTRAINVRRGKSTKITLEIADKIRNNYKIIGMTQKLLAEKYGIDQTTISLVIKNKIWRHI